MVSTYFNNLTSLGTINTIKESTLCDVYEVWIVPSPVTSLLISSGLVFKHSHLISSSGWASRLG